MSPVDEEHRIAVLEHALRKASARFAWLAKHHVQGAFATEACRKLSDEFWNIQAGTPAIQPGAP